MRKLIRRVTVGTLTALMTCGAIVYAQKQATLFVTVVSAPGALGDLKAKDFTANGGKLQIKDAVRATEPLAIEILVDVSRPPSGVTPPIQDVRTALQSFVQTIRSAEPAARIGLIQVAGAAVPAVNLGAPAAAVDKAIGMVAPGPDLSGGAVMIEGLQDASKALADEPAPRRAIVCVDFSSSDSFPDSRVGGVVKDMIKTGASVWSVTVRASSEQTTTNGSSTALYNVRDSAFNSIIKNNGGLHVTIVDVTGLKSQLQTIANSLLSQYELTIDGIDAAHARDVKLATASGAKVVPSVFVR
jgi:hypothetical protein